MDYCHGEFTFAQCRLCGDQVNDPRILSCWHVFCQECIMGYNTEDQYVKCPVCRQTTPLPVEGIPGLHHRARGFLSRIGSESPKIADFTNDVYLRHYCPHRAKQVKDFRKCFIPATRRCVECDEYLCSQCSPHHLLEMHQTPPTACKRHDKAEDFYCEDCNIVTCSYCATTVHIHHDTWEIEEVAEGFREIMQYWLDQWRHGRWQIEQDLENSIREINTQIQMQSDLILDTIINILQQREQELLDQVDKFAIDMWSRFQEEKSKHSLECSHLRPLCDFSENLVRFGTDREIVTLHREMTQHLESAVQDLEPTKMPVDLQTELFFVPQKLPGVADWIQIGTVSLSTPDSTTTSRRKSSDSGQGSRSSSELSLASVELARRPNQFRVPEDDVSESNENIHLHLLMTTEAPQGIPLSDREDSPYNRDDTKTKHGTKQTDKHQQPSTGTKIWKKLLHHGQKKDEQNEPEKTARKTEEGEKKVVQSARRGSTYQRVVVPAALEEKEEQQSEEAAVKTEEQEHFNFRRQRSHTFDLTLLSETVDDRTSDMTTRSRQRDENSGLVNSPLETADRQSNDTSKKRSHLNWRKQRSYSHSPQLNRREHFDWRKQSVESVLLDQDSEKQRGFSAKGQQRQQAWRRGQGKSSMY